MPVAATRILSAVASAIKRRCGMPKTVTIEICETAEQLKALLLQQTNVVYKERVQALFLLKSGQFQQVIDVARALGRDRATVQRWLSKYRAGGLSQLLAPRLGQGRKPAIPAEIKQQLQQRLLQPGSFKTYGEVQAWLQQEFGLLVNYPVVYNTVRYQMNMKLSSAAGREANPGPGVT